MRMFLFIIALMQVTSFNAFGDTFTWVYDPYFKTYKMVRSCVAPNFISLNPQTGYTLQQTCFCTWTDQRSAGLVLTCNMPQGKMVLQTADPRYYQLEAINANQNRIVVISNKNCNNDKGTKNANQNGINNGICKNK